MQIASIEKACKTLTDAKIEELLQEKIGNMCIYTHYDLAEHKAGLLSPLYNGKKVKFIRFGDDADSKVIKSALESKNHEIKLVATAMKTIRTADWSYGGEYAFRPVYDRKSLLVCGNVIFLDKKTGKFHAMEAWLCIHSCADARQAHGVGLSVVMRSVANVRCLQSPMLTQISDTLHHVRASQGLQR